VPCVSIPASTGSVVAVEPAIIAISCKSGPPAFRASRWLFAPPITAFGVGNEEKALSPVRSADTARSKYHLPNGVRFRFQVSLNKVEPAESNCTFNLLSKDRCRFALADESEPMRPEVASILKPFTFAG
jgi:hypothetical protein